MKIFISWSGERSQALAKVLHEHLRLVLHYVQPWKSEEDVHAGNRWAQDVAKGLDASNFGIICVTPENQKSPWLLFESGALAKYMQDAKVIPLLFDLEVSELTGHPLGQFQAKKVSKEGLEEIVQSINHLSNNPVPDEDTKRLFNAFWPQIKEKIDAIPSKAPSVKSTRPQSEILEDLVAGVRGLDNRFRDLEGTMFDGPIRDRKRRRRIDPMMMDEIFHIASKSGDAPITLLMMASLIREDMPWLYELVADVYREVKSGHPNDAREAIDRLRRTIKLLRHGPIGALLADGSMESEMILMEFPRVMDRFLHRYLVKQPDGPSEDVLIDTLAGGET